MPFPYGLQGTQKGSRGFVFSCAVSFLCHGALFTALIVAPDLSSDRRISAAVIDVNLVALPPEAFEPAGRSQKTNIAGRPSPPQETTRATVARGRDKPDAVGLGPRKYRVKRSLKRQTFKTARILKRTISQIEKKVEQSRAKPVVKAIDRLKQTVGKDTPTRGDNQGATGQDASGPGERRLLELMDIYRAEIGYQIRRNWVLSDHLAGGREDLAAWLGIEIGSDGHISKIWFEARSGDRYFDDQAYKAVQKANPLPPLPEGYSRPYFRVGLRFTPEGPE